MADEYNRLVSILESQVFQSDSTQSEVGIQRETNHRYYTTQPLGNEIKGRSHYVAPVVPYHVEDKKAVYSEAFLSGRRVLKFLAGDGETQEQADLKTAYVEDQLEKNNWYQTLRDGWHDALVAKKMVMWREWKNDVDTTVYEVKRIPRQQLLVQLQGIRNITDVDLTQTEMDGDLVSGPVRVYTDSSHVEVKLIQPERFFRDTSQAYPATSAWCAHSEDLTRSELIDQGYDEELVNKLNKERRFRRQEEDYARRAHDRSASFQRQQNRLDEQELITCYTTCGWLNLSNYIDDTPDEVRLYKIRWAAGELLHDSEGNYDITELSAMPYREWTQYKISHADHGYCDSDMLRTSQKARSIMIRGALDNQNMANMGKLELVTRNIENMPDVTDPRIGGHVHVKQLGSVAPLATPPLSAAWPAVLETLEQDAEAKSGSNRLAKGMNADALSSNNSGDMIARLTNSANKRPMRECRDFAKTFLVPMYQDIYEIGVRNDTGLYSLMANGQMTTVAPQQWQGVAPKCDIHVALTAEEGVRHAMALSNTHMLMAQDPVLGQLYTAEKRHNLMFDMMDALGVVEPGRYMIDPASPEYMQMMQMQQAMQQQQEQMQMNQMQFQQWLMQSADGREWHKARVEEIKARADVTNLATDNMRADEELTHNKVVDMRKLDIEEQKAWSDGR